MQRGTEHEERKRGVSEIWDILRTARRETAAEVDDVVRRETETVLELFDAETEQLGQETMDTAASRCRSDMLDHLLDERFVGHVAEATDADSPDLQVLAFDLRHAAAPLKIELPEPLLEIRVSMLMLAAGVGSLFGMAVAAWLCVVLRLPSDGAETARAIGALFGPAVVVALAYSLTRHDRLRKVLQWGLGILAVGIGVTEILGWINPAGQLWRVLTARWRGRTLWVKIKLLLTCVVLIILLQLAKPLRRTNRPQLRKTVESTIRSWLVAQIDLLTLLIASQGLAPRREQAEDVAPVTSPALLESLTKLAGARTDSERSDIAIEVIQACENAGLTFATPRDEGAFDESMLDAYDVIGLISPGDPYRELEPPVLQGDRVLVKGKLTRKRGG